MARKELYEDVLEEEPPMDCSPQEQKKWEKRLHDSIGWYDFELSKEHYDYDVNLPDGGYTCEDQTQAIILSLLVQINERLKRIEKR